MVTLGENQDLPEVAPCRGDTPTPGQNQADHERRRLNDKLRMPGMNGAEAAAAILSRHPTTRVIALTVAPHGHLAEQARAAGIAACVPKSAPYTALLNAVHAA
jgi:DNA-binding NarL/FixJ family response regulator